MDDALPFAKDRKPDVNIASRKPLSKFEFAVLFLHQKGLCAKCSAPLEAGKTRDEHLDALHLGGGNELTNRALWCLDCTKPKDKADKKAIAKSRRLRGEAGQAKRRAERGPLLKGRSTFDLSKRSNPSSEKKGGRRLVGRGFDKSRSRKFSGEVVPRG